MLGPRSAVRASKKSGPRFYLEKWNVTGQLRKFVEKILKKIMLSVAEVERVFSRQKSILTNLRDQLSPGIVEKMLFVRYKAKKLGDHAFSQFSQAGPDECYFEELEPDEPSETYISRLNF